MPQVKFYLKNPKESQSSIFAILHFDCFKLDCEDKKNFVRLKYSIGETIKTKFWNPKTQRAKEILSFPEYSEFNSKLNDIQTDILNSLRKLENDKITPTVKLLKQEIDKLRKPQQTEYKPDLLTYIDDYIKRVKVAYIGIQPVIINERTKQKYRTTLKVLREFAESQRKKTYDFDEIDLEFYYDFVEYLKTKKKYSVNTCGKYITTLKKFLSAATEEGKNTNTDYKSKRFASFSELTDKIYLTENELLKMYNLDLSKNKRLESVRDLFLIGCYTALRFSDFTNIKPENLYTNDNGTFFKINTQKTGAQVMIPIHYIVKEILEKYNNELPKVISNQKMNEYIKEVGEKAKINDLISMPNKNNEPELPKPKHKYELISTHTARRTGATNMFLNKIPAHSIMMLTGHKTEQAFLSYLRFSNEDNANLLIEFDYFKPKSNLKAV